MEILISGGGGGGGVGTFIRHLRVMVHILFPPPFKKG